MPTLTAEPDPASIRPGPPTVTAVVVAHQGARWLPELQAAVQSQTRRPDHVVAADTSSRDVSSDASSGVNTDPGADLLRDWVGTEHLVLLPDRTGFGDAVRAALALAPGPPPGTADVTSPPSPTTPTTGPPAATHWVWLLHDDCAPAPEALAALLATAARDPAVAIVGPKIRAWTDRRLLLEVGLTISRSGRRETLLDGREQDQGQHDGTRAVLAVNTAGMLVRRDVWERLGGLDPRLPFLRDDVDLGWRANLAGHKVVCTTDAVVHHVEAGARGDRSLGTGTGATRLTRPTRLHRMDRTHATYVVLANLPLSLVPLAAVTLTMGTLLRALGLLVGKRPAAAADEVLAHLSVLGRPDRLVAARVARRRTRVVPARRTLPLLAPRSAGLRHLVETASLVTGTRSGEAGAGRRRRLGLRATSAPATGPTPEGEEDLPSWGSGLVRRVLLRASVGLAVALVLLTLVAVRGLLGDGRLVGGALLPAPDSVAALWRGYVAVWHPVGVGSDTAAPPYLAVLALLGTVVGGASRAVDLLLLAAVPLAGLSAYLAVRRVVRPPSVRIWAAVTYALLPPVLGAVAAGRLGTAVLAVLLPVVAGTLARALGLGGADRRGGDDRSTWAAVLLLTVMTAFVPLSAALVAVLAGCAAVVLRGRNLLRLAVLVLTPPVLLLPWLPAVLEDPALLLLEGGLPGPGLTAADLSPLDVLLLRPGGPGLPPVLVGAAVVLAALAALLRRDGRRPVVLGWVLALVGLASAWVVSGLEVSPPTLAGPVPAWPGPALVLAGAGLLLAAAAGAEGTRLRVATSSFGWRQPGAIVVTMLAVVAPIVAAGWWAVAGAGGPLERRDPVLLPAFVAAEGDGPDRPRTLVLRSLGPGRLSYSLLRSAGPRTGDAEVSPRPDAGTGLDPVVADLASGRGGDAAARLVPYGVRFVLLRRPVLAVVAQAVDAVPGMVRVSGPAGSVLWRIDYPTGRLRVLPPGSGVVGEDGAPPPARVVAAGQVRADALLGSGEPGRLLVLADPRDEGWQATLDGAALTPRTYDGWAQAFVLPADGGRLRLRHDQGLRTPLLWLQLGAVLVVVLLALPTLPLARTHGPGASDGLPAEDPGAAGPGAAGLGAAVQEGGGGVVRAVPVAR